MSSKSHKREKYQEKMLNELNLILRRDLNDARLQFVSITKVELNQDYSVAKVFWDTFDAGKRGEIKKALKRAEGRMRTLLSQLLKVRSIPTIELVYDNQYEEERKITEILDDEEKLGKSFS